VKVLGIDPGIRALGWGVVDSSEKALSWGTIYTKASSSLPSKLLQIEREIISVIEEFKPDMAAMEAVVFHKNPRSALLLGAARAVVLLTLEHHKIPVLELSPTTIKRALVGSGNAKKEQVAFMVKRLLNLSDESSLHASDALACALVGIWREKKEEIF